MSILQDSIEMALREPALFVKRRDDEPAVAWQARAVRESLALGKSRQKVSISELADLGAVAAAKHVPITHMIEVDSTSPFYSDDKPAREAFARAIVNRLKKVASKLKAA